MFVLPSDVERPSFGLTCPGDIKRYADRSKNYTAVTWIPVEATDNSGMPPNVTSSGVESRYYEGKHEIVYNATDEAGNYKICKFHVTVEGKLLTLYQSDRNYRKFALTMSKPAFFFGASDGYSYSDVPVTLRMFLVARF